jgi:hypothetical protein
MPIRTLRCQMIIGHIFLKHAQIQLSEVRRLTTRLKQNCPPHSANSLKGMSMKQIILFWLLALICTANCEASLACNDKNNEAHGSGRSAKLITSDIDLFWRAYDMAALNPQKSVDIFRTEYLNKGSIGLGEFTKLRIGNAENLANAVRSSPKYYSALRKSSRQVRSYAPQIQAAFRCLKKLYPEAIIPDVYFVVGILNSAGTTNGNRLYVGVDMFGRDGDASIQGLGSWHKAVIKPVDHIPAIVAHEIIHVQQEYPADDSLLAAALKEGIADFIGEKISGKNINHHLHLFSKDREHELWQNFAQEMYGKQIDNWLYQGDKGTTDRPADLGYYMGYKIAEAYYQQRKNKRQAIKDMLSIRDFSAFLKASSYEESYRELTR